MSLLTRTPNDRIERVAVRPAMESTFAVARVGRLDGRTRVIAVRDHDGWRPGTGPWNRTTAEHLRRGSVSEVLLRRRFRRARVLLAWLPRPSGS